MNNERIALLRKRQRKQLEEFTSNFPIVDTPLEKLSKKKLLEILEGIYGESRDFYVIYQGWECNNTAGFDRMRDDAFFDAWDKFRCIMNWASGKNLETIPKQGGDDF